MRNEKIIKVLVNCCINNTLTRFLPYLFLCRKINTGFPNKWSYYQCLRGMLKKCMHEGENKAIGKITVVVKPSPLRYRSTKAKAYYFYDEVHQHERMYILIEDQPEKIILDLFPF